MRQCIENPNEVDWLGFWAERLEGKITKNWDEAAPGFYKRTRKDDYQDALWAQYNKWQSQSDGILSFYNFKTREYDIVNSDNSPYTASDNLHFTKFTYGQYGNAFAQFLLENVFD